MQREIECKTKTIKAAMAALGARLDEGDESELLVWVIPRAFACAHRPLRHHRIFGRAKKGRYLPSKAAPAVLEWIRRVKELGIRSIICLMHPNELKHYAALDLGAPNLIESYQQIDIEVRHIPWDDPGHRQGLSPATYEEELARVRVEVLNSFDDLPKPVLLHCSAGIDRSSPVAAFVYCSRALASEA